MGKNKEKASESARMEMPLGLSFGMAMDEEAMSRFGRLSKEEKRQVADKARQAKSKAEMDALIRDIAQDKWRG